MSETWLKFCILIFDTKFWEEAFYGACLFNQLYNLHLKNFVHDQDLSCCLYAQQLKQAQENYQKYNLKDSLC